MDNVKLQLNHLLFSSDLGLRESEARYVETLAPILSNSIKSGTTDDLLDVLAELETVKESELKQHCEACTEPFLHTADYLEQISLGAGEIGSCAEIVQAQIARSGSELIDSKLHHQSLSNTTNNIGSTLDTLRICLKALEYTNQVHTLLRQNHRIAAVQAISDLSGLGLQNMRHLGLGKMLSRAIPGLTQLVLSSTKSQLDEFLEKLGQNDLEIGNTAVGCLERQRDTWKKLQKRHEHLAAFRFNSYAERAYRESTSNFFDVDQIGLELGPLYETQLVYSKLGKLDELLPYIHQARLHRSRLLDSTDWQHLRQIIGFYVVERVISESMPELRAANLVKDTWDQFCQRFLPNLSKHISQTKTLEELGPMRVAITEFMETLENFGFKVTPVASVLHELLRHLSKLALQANHDQFIQMWNSADHMPMVVNRRELYETIRGVVFEGLETTPAAFPKALPFSEIYPFMCVDLRHLITLHSTFFDQFQRDPYVVEDTMLKAVDSYLCDTVCKTMVQSVSTDNREKLVQTVIDLKYLWDASVSVRSLLQQNRMSGRRGKLNLMAVGEFENGYKQLESKIFDLVNTQINSFISVADYDWQQEKSQGTQSPYALDMAAYLLTLANSVLARLPSDLRSFVYLSCIDHLNSQLLNLLLSAPDTVSPQSMQDFDVDLKFLENAVEELTGDDKDKNALSSVNTLTEVRQCVDLLREDDPKTAYNNAEIRMRKYDRLRPEIVAQLLQKLATPVSTPKMQQSTAKFMRYLSGDKT